MGEKPKSAFEIAMEKLAASDRESGESSAPLSDAQKERIGEARRVFSARMAEREILYKDSLARTFDPAALAKLEEEFQTDRRRHEADRDREIEGIRREGGPGHR